MPYKEEDHRLIFREFKKVKLLQWYSTCELGSSIFYFPMISVTISSGFNYNFVGNSGLFLKYCPKPRLYGVSEPKECYIIGHVLGGKYFIGPVQ